MESAPPSYESANPNDVWQLVAPYLTSDQLCQASVVSRRWHSIFAAQLWGKPTSHFGLEYDGVLDRLARFQRTLGFARPHVRSYPFCLHLTPSEAIYFDDRPADWLKRLLGLLPSLQALVVKGVPFFDHAACQMLHQDGLDIRVLAKSSAPSSSTGAAAYHLPRSEMPGDLFHGLRLLDASHCNNLTSTSLANGLRRFPSLLYVDLSFTRASKSPVVFEAFRQVYALKILKLRGVQLRDTDLSLLSSAVGRRVCHLDIRDNELTSAAVNIARELCSDDAEVDDTHYDLFEDAHLDNSIYTAYTTHAVNHLTIEDIAEEGVLQLRISGNQLDGIALSKLLHMPSLRVLDIGQLTVTPRSALLISRDMLCRLAYLRVDYAIFVPQNSTSDELGFHPGRLPHLSTLILSNVPTHSKSDHLAGVLIALVKACARENAKAVAQARNDYTAPPGRHGQPSTLLQAARRTYGLHTIVLEISSSSQGQPSRSISLTEDRDSETMWSAGETDFSFFCEGGGLTSSAEMRVNRAPDSTFSEPRIDNLLMLSAFRNSCRIAHERAVLHDKDQTTEGYWPGIIRVDRGSVKDR